MKILLVENDDSFIQMLTRSLTTHQYVVDVVNDGEMGWTYGSTFEYDLIVLDVVLPKLDGISLCKRLRAKGYATPIVLLTAQNSRTVKVQGLDAGADDYVVKPCDPVELMARMRAVLRRSSTQPFPLLAWGALLLNPSTCEVSYNGQPLALTTKEYELLELFLRASQSVFGSDELIDRLWSSEEFPSEATVRSHIRRVRQKLAAVGAPSDLIATLHGRGYYLKVIETAHIAACPASPHAAIAPSKATGAHPMQHLDAHEVAPLAPDSQQQYLAFLNETWITTQPKSLAQIAVLAQAVRDLERDRLTALQQAEAQQIARTLTGTLSLFGFTKTMPLVRQLDAWFGGREPLQPRQAALMQTLVTELQQAVQQTTQIQRSQVPDQPSPRLLLVSTETTLNQSLQAAATACGLQLECVPTLEPPYAWHTLPPQVLLLRLPSESTPPKAPQPSTRQLLEALEAVTQRYPTVSVLVMGDRGDLSDRLAVLRRGGKLFLTAQTSIEQVMAAVVQTLREQALTVHVMIVDSDRTWLSTLPTLLKPWGFKVTTLADPSQFWTVLQSVVPDVLVLEVNLPEINGFELCQLLRSDPQWQRVPVLFLSDLSDATSQQQAFMVGADDYLCKPVMGVTLANRLLSRLQRLRACAD